MRFNPDDLQVLTNFSNINQNIAFRKGSTIQTISTMKNILCEYQMCNNEIPKDFCIYDLGEFLDIHDLFDKPEIKIKDDKVILKDKRFTSHYPTAEKSIVVAPTKSIELDNYDYQFTIRKKDIEDYLLIRKRTRNKLPDFLIQNNKGNFNFKLTDIKNRNSANVDFNVDEDNKTNRQFMFHLKCENFDKILIDDYDAEVSPDKLLMLYNRNKFLKYWIALEPSSEFDSNESEVKNNA